MDNEIRDSNLQTNRRRREYFQDMVHSLDTIFESHSKVLTKEIQNAILGMIFVDVELEFWPDIDQSSLKSIVAGSFEEGDLFYRKFGWIKTKELHSFHADNARLTLAFMAEELKTRKDFIDDQDTRQRFLQWTQNGKADRILQPWAGTVRAIFTHSVLKVAELQVLTYKSDSNDNLEKVAVFSGLDRRFCDDLIDLRKFWSGGSRRKSVPMACGTFGDSYAGEGGKGGWSRGYEAFSMAEGFDHRFQRLGIPIQGLQMRFKSDNWDYS
jgi:hypothetical protein